MSGEGMEDGDKEGGLEDREKGEGCGVLECRRERIGEGQN